MTADNSKGVIRAARFGDVWFMSDHNRVAELKDLVALYEEHRSGTADDFNRSGSSGHAQDGVRGRDAPRSVGFRRPYIEEFWRDYYGTMNHAAEMDVPDDFNQPFEQLWQDRFLLADPGGCVEEIQRYREELGADSVVFHLPGALERQIRAMELLSTKVFPRLR